uniref:Uncharacterized protein n=1 Tax=Tanacetum cinerariifolium TaxID=118510 RepID=A0A6L2P4W7_TANCI|nr:hypothetical protein [Tanacetum cinerariifolium]
MSGTIPLIPPPFGASSGNPGSPNVKTVDTMPTTTYPINTTKTKNVSQSVVDENLPQLIDSRGGSHVTNVPAFDKEDFMSQKVRFLVFLDGLEPYLLKTLENGPFVPMSRDTKIAALRLNFNAFKSLEWEKVNGTFARLQRKVQGLKAEMVVLTKRIDDMAKGKSKIGKKDNEKSEKGLLAKSFDWDDESVSSDDEGSTKIRAFMKIVEDEP